MFSNKISWILHIFAFEINWGPEYDHLKEPKQIQNGGSSNYEVDHKNMDSYDKWW